jgi:recombination protein RecA
MARTRKVAAEAADVVRVPPRRPGASAFAEIAARSKSFRPARDVLRRVRAVPTIFPAVDWRTRVGGWPIDRVTIVHGPSGYGKTKFNLGLGLSFLRRGHMFCPIDAELSTPFPWVETLYAEHADNPAFLASRPTSYEQAVDDVKKVAEGLALAREKGKVPPETSALFVVDSIGKLQPQNMQEKIRKFGAESEKGSVDGMSGAAGLMKAALHKSWLDDLIPLMYATGCGIVLVVREAKDMNASARDRQFGADWKLQGGNSPMYESSLVVRISHASMVYEGDGDENAVGERHTVQIHKTKVSAREDKIEQTYFWTSNGTKHAEGFDRARDLLYLGGELGVLKKAGTWISFARNRWQGETRFVATVKGEQLDEIEAACRAKFDTAKSDVVGAA